MAFNYIIPTNTTSRDRLIENYQTEIGTDELFSEVRYDAQIAISVQPVLVNPPGSDTLYSPDYIGTDTFQAVAGTIDTSATGGTFKLTANGSTTGMTLLAYNISAANLQTPLSAIFAAASKPLPTVTLLATGSYRIDGATNGAITTGYVVGDGTNLTPGSNATITEVSLGSSTSAYRLILTLFQAPLAYATPSTVLSAAGVAVATTQAGSATSDQIQTVSFTNSPYTGTFRVDAAAGLEKTITSNTVANPTVITSVAHGFSSGQSVVIPYNNGSTPTIAGTRVVTVITADTYSIPVNVTVATNTTGAFAYILRTTTAGVANPNMTAQDFGLMLAAHPDIEYQNPDGTADNIIPKKNGTSFTVQFTGTLGNSSAMALTVTNIDLVGGQGVSGFIDYNTETLFEYSLTTTGDYFTVPFSIIRTRASGERRTIYGPVDQTIYKSNLDPTSLIPVPLTSYYTAAQSNVLFVNAGTAFGYTGLTGGGATNLDGITTLNMTRGRLVFINDATYGPGLWENVTGTTAENAGGGVVRADDYATTTNESIWLRRF